jgi:hypothetical protein
MRPVEHASEPATQLRSGPGLSEPPVTARGRATDFGCRRRRCFRVDAADCLLTIGSAANTRLVGTCVWSPKHSRCLRPCKRRSDRPGDRRCAGRVAHRCSATGCPTAGFGDSPAPCVCPRAEARVQLVGRRRRRRTGVASRDLHDSWHHHLGHELLALLPRLPDLKDPKSVVGESRCVDDESGRISRLRHDRAVNRVVVRGAGLVGPRWEILDKRKGHCQPLQLDRRDEYRRSATLQQSPTRPWQRRTIDRLLAKRGSPFTFEPVTPTR